MRIGKEEYFYDCKGRQMKGRKEDIIQVKRSLFQVFGI